MLVVTVYPFYWYMSDCYLYVLLSRSTVYCRYPPVKLPAALHSFNRKLPAAPHSFNRKFPAAPRSFNRKFPAAPHSFNRKLPAAPQRTLGENRALALSSCPSLKKF